MSRPQRIGIFGGTFDPPHVGHVVAALTVAHELELDRVLLVVANVPWQKAGEREITRSEHRLAMVRQCVAEWPGLEASSVEIDRGGESYTADTLEGLAQPDRRLFLVLGSDAAVNLPTWQRTDPIKELAEVVVIARPGTDHIEPPPGWDWTTVPSPLMDLSSTDLRWRLESGRPVDLLVPEPALAYIRAHELYR